MTQGSSGRKCRHSPSAVWLLLLGHLGFNRHSGFGLRICPPAGLICNRQSAIRNASLSRSFPKWGVCLWSLLTGCRRTGRPAGERHFLPLQFHAVELAARLLPGVTSVIGVEEPVAHREPATACGLAREVLGMRASRGRTAAVLTRQRELEVGPAAFLV